MRTISIVAELRVNGYVVAARATSKRRAEWPKAIPRAALTRHGGLFATLEASTRKSWARRAFVDFAFTHFERMARLHAWLVALHG
jgi:hypothetical protein